MNIFIPTLQFSAFLNGPEEVPAVPNSPGMGTCSVVFNSSLTAMTVRLVISRLVGVTAAHIHLGRRGVAGPIVVPLSGPLVPPDAITDRVITDRVFTAADLTGPLMGMPLSVLFREMLAGNTYANVHTMAHPMGEIRGQLVRLL